MGTYLGVPVRFRDVHGIDFVLIPPGEFDMGSTPKETMDARKIAGDNGYWQMCFDAEFSKHRVVLTTPFFLAVNEVTQAR